MSKRQTLEVKSLLDSDPQIRAYKTLFQGYVDCVFQALLLAQQSKCNSILVLGAKDLLLINALSKLLVGTEISLVVYEEDEENAQKAIELVGKENVIVRDFSEFDVDVFQEKLKFNDPSFDLILLDQIGTRIKGLDSSIVRIELFSHLESVMTENGELIYVDGSMASSKAVMRVNDLKRSLCIEDAAEVAGEDEGLKELSLFHKIISGLSNGISQDEVTRLVTSFEGKMEMMNEDAFLFYGIKSNQREPQELRVTEEG